MNPILMDAIIAFALFLDLSDDDATNPHVAVAQMEQLASILQGLSPEEGVVLATYAQEKALAEQHIAGSSEWTKKLMSLGKDYGLIE